MSQGPFDQQQVEMLLNTMREQGGGIRTDMTKTIHRTVYPAIDPKRPELSQKGRTVLITGGGTGIGLAIAKAFTQSGALRIIITGRRAEVLAEAQKEIQAEAEKDGKSVEVLIHPLDVSDRTAVAALWNDLKEKSIEVDVLVLNAAKVSSANGLGPLLANPVDDIWSSYETNVLGPLSMTAGMEKQNVGKYKVYKSAFGYRDEEEWETTDLKAKNIINISTQSVFQFRPEHNIVSHMNPAYSLSKNAGTLLNQVVAEHADPERLQVVSLHPGVLFTAGFGNAGVASDMLPFDDFSLSASTAVYLASPEAKFLHGRFIWASWDVDELKNGELRSLIDEDAEFLKIGVHGIKGDGNRKW